MIKSSDIIEHAGIVWKIQKDTLLVKILVTSACSACHAKGSCIAADMAEKIIEVQKPKIEVGVGDCITVTLKRSLGFKALVLGYILPFIILFATLAIVLEVTQDELTAGLSAIAVLVPYYGLLFVLRKALSQKFQFELKR